MADYVKCPKCGEENPKTNRFCDSCGAKLAVREEPAAAKQQAVEAPEKKKAKPAAEKQAKRPMFGGAAVQAEEEYAPAATGGITINWEVLAWAAILIFTVCTRFTDLGIKPLHHDESMHAFYGWKLFMGDGYSYNPMMHGPFHYHANALIYFLFGTSDYTARVAPAIYGVIGVMLMYFFKPYVGKLGAVLCALAMAISPTWMYQARFIREDIFMAVDTIMLFIGLMRYFDSRKPEWLYLAMVGFAFAWATKEANYITMAIFGSFLFLRWLWEYQYRSNPEKLEKEASIYNTIRYWLAEGRTVFFIALGVFVFVHGALYFNKQPGAGFWSNFKGIWDGYVGGLVYWWGQHGVHRGDQPWNFYVYLLPFYEMLSVFFMLIASVYYIMVREKRTFFNLFVIWWWIWAMILYSWAGEKMPWLAIHPLLPMLILAGKFSAEMMQRIDWGWKRSIGTAVFILLCMASIHGAIYVCFYGAGANPKESLVYVQTSTDVTLVAKKIIRFADEVKRQKWNSQEFRDFDPTNLEIVCEDYCTWPFAWYLRDFKKIAYDPKDIPMGELGKPIILSGIEEANPGHDQRVKDLLTGDTIMLNGKSVKKTPDQMYYYERYKLREWWAPDRDKWWKAPPFSQPGVPGKIEMLWKRFMYRDVWNDLGSYDFVVYVRKDLEKYWVGGE
jgi:uncharacterized protein (TIGR03663 family)